MPNISAVTVGAPITAAKTNQIIADVNRIGRIVVLPTSVAGSGVTLNSATGVVTASAASSVNVNGCFSDLYTSYQIEYILETSASVGLNLRMRASGTDATTNYDNQRFTNISATLSAQRNAGGSSFQADTITLIGTHAGNMKLVDPFAATQTLMFTDYLSFDATMTTSSGEGRTNGRHRTATSYDGFTINPPSGTVTGTIKVYGLT